jgi:hypothetical protein
MGIIEKRTNTLLYFLVKLAVSIKHSFFIVYKLEACHVRSYQN